MSYLALSIFARMQSNIAQNVRDKTSRKNNLVEIQNPNNKHVYLIIKYKLFSSNLLNNE